MRVSIRVDGDSTAFNRVWFDSSCVDLTRWLCVVTLWFGLVVWWWLVDYFFLLLGVLVAG